MHAVTALFVLLLALPLAAQKPRLLQALENCGASACVFAGTMSTELRATDADEDEKKPSREPGTWGGSVELVRAPQGSFVLVAQGKPSRFALLVRGARRLLEAEAGADRTGVPTLVQVLPAILDFARLKKWIQRAAARRRVIASKDPKREEGMRYRVRLPARAVLPEKDEDEDEDEDDSEHEPVVRKMIVHVDLVFRVDAKNVLQDLRLEVHETAPVAALEHAWKKACAKVEGDQIARLRIRGETMRELEEDVRRVRVLELHRKDAGSETTKAASARLESRAAR